MKISSKKSRTIRSRMFFTYACVLTVMITGFIVFYAMQTYLIIRKETDVSMQQLSDNLSYQLDNEIKQMSLLSEKIVFSSPVRDIMFNQLPYSSGATLYRLTDFMDSLLYSICGPSLAFYHMNIINLEGYQYAFGQDYYSRSVSRADLLEIPWINETIAADGRMVIVPVRTSELSMSPEKVLSITRGFSTIIGMPIRGVVEIQRDYNYLSNLIERYTSPDSSYANNRSVFVFSNNGKLIYPLDLDEKKVDYYFKFISDRSSSSTSEDEEDNIFYKNSTTENNEIMYYTQSEYSGFITVVALHKEVLTIHIRTLVYQSMLIGLFLLFIAGILSMHFSKKFSYPIQVMSQSMKNFDLQNPNECVNMQLDSGFDEIELLNTSFNLMAKRLHDSLDEMVELKNMEMHSRMLALQAQMNPHFLYNTLTVISIMADSGEKQNVQWACANLSNMLSYVSSDAFALVSLQEELSHTCNYIELIKMRYMDDICFGIDVPKNLRYISVPKLVIQPLIENSVKYATVKDPIWTIDLRIWIEDNYWYVCVSDNGIGFSTNKVVSIEKTISEISQGQSNIPLSLNGMGILNIYLRLKYYYQDDLVFKIDNNPGNGVSVTIGGKI